MFEIRRNSGFTLLELLITIAILGIVATVAVPSFREMVMNNRLATQTNEMSSLINLARSEASKMGDGVVTVCASSNGATSSPTCNGGDSWESGLIVFYDDDMDVTLDAPTDQLLKVSGPLAGGNTLRINGMTSDGGNYVQFDSKGFPRASATTGKSAGSFVICDSRGGVEARAILINLSGQSNLARDTDGDGTVNENDGILDSSVTEQNISCPP